MPSTTPMASAWFHARPDPNAAQQAGVQKMDEASRMAINFSRLPELLRQAGTPPTPMP
jgi:hypothetical protein